MMNEPNSMHAEHSHMHFLGMKRMSWSAILAGALVAIGLSFLLNLFCVAIGLSAFNMSADGKITVAIGGFIALLIGSIAAMFAAGWVAGFIGRACCIKHNWGVLYGFVAWCLALVLSVLLASSFGAYINSYGEFVSNPASIGVTNNERAPMVTTNERTQTNARGTNVNAEPIAVVNMMKATDGLALGAFILFIIFIIGALSSCFGGYAGMESRKKCMMNEGRNC